MDRPTRLLFVCMGNIMRSPAAEALFRHHAGAAGILGRYEIDSAAITDWNAGSPPAASMRAVAGDRGVVVDGVARQVRPEDFAWADWILVMEHEHVLMLAPRAANEREGRKIRQLREFDPIHGGDLDIRDPHSGPRELVEATYEILDRSVRGLLEALESGALALDGAETWESA
ncbi:MAG: low molecular weight phosphotyrosine protein phosphatase [Myxococcales bacterium]|nr:low molecular weight phosphotyrosine protein phosphatase [Myxococcales bacterium]